MRSLLLILLVLPLSNAMFSRATNATLPGFTSEMLPGEDSGEVGMGACMPEASENLQKQSGVIELNPVKTASLRHGLGGINGLINVICFIPKFTIIGFNLYIIWFVMLRKKTWARESAMV